VRGRLQPFSSDFRGFLFQDNQLGVRLFGNRDNNRYQYNLAASWRIEKDTNSGLNDVASGCATTMSSSPTCLPPGPAGPRLTSQMTGGAYNRNREGDEIHDRQERLPGCARR
jgi:hypothetical protein